MKLPFLRSTDPDTTNRQIFRAALIVAFFTVVAKGGSAAKELVVAQSFGRSDALDAFLIAYLLPSFGLSLVAGALAAALLPAFVEVREKQGAEAARKLFASVMVLCVLASLAVATLLGLLAPYYLPFVGSGFSVEKLRLTRELLYALLPFVVFNGIAACASAVLNAGEKFALPSLVPLATPLATILFIEIYAAKWGPFSLAAGVVAGSVLEAVLLVWALQAHGMPLAFHWNGFDPGVRAVLGQYGPMVAGSFLMAATGVVDQSMAAILPGGSVAALAYGNRVISFVLALGATALSTAVFPYFSKMVAQKDWNGCRHTLKRYSALVVLTTVPLTACLMIFSRPLVALLFQRGAFTSADTDLVTRVQIFYALQIPFYVWSMLFVRFVSSTKRNHVLMYIALINLVLDVVLNLVLMRIWGVAGIALSTSLFYFASFLFISSYSLWLLARERTAARTEMMGHEPLP